MKDKIAEILRDNVTYSPQVDAVVIHGAIEKIQELIRTTSIQFGVYITTGCYQKPTDGWINDVGTMYHNWMKEK